MNVTILWLFCVLVTSEFAICRSKDIVDKSKGTTVADGGIILGSGTPAINCEKHGGVIFGKSCKLPQKTTASTFEVSEDNSSVSEEGFHESFHQGGETDRSMFLQVYREYHRFLDNVYNVLEGKYENINITEQCAINVKQLKKLVTRNDKTAQKFIDSTGRPHSNTAEGGVSYLGSFSQCLEAQVEGDKVSFVGKYCLVKFEVMNKTNFPEEIVGISTIRNARPVVGLCVPSSCTIEDATASVNGSLPAFPTEEISFSMSCQTKEKLPFDSNAKGMICAVVFLVVLTLANSFHERIKNKRSEKTEDVPLRSVSTDSLRGRRLEGSSPAENEPINDQPLEDETVNDPDVIRPTSDDSSSGRPDIEPTIPIWKTILMAFSVKINLSEVFDLKSKEGSIECVDGLRLISMIVILFSHTFFFATGTLFFRNPQDVNDVGGTFLYFIMSLATLAVDSFYFMSGLVICYATYKKIDAAINVKDSFIFWLNFIVRRYFRLTPVMMALIAFGATLLHYTSSGPNYIQSISMYNSWCQQNWWRNLLHIQNFGNTENMCYGHSWYISTDMQFSLLAPFIIVGLHKFPKIGVFFVVLMCLGSMINTADLTYRKNFPAVPFFTANDVPQELMNQYYREIYITPHTRIVSYLIGMLMGYFLIKKPNGVKSKAKRFLAWMFGILIMLAVLSNLYLVTVRTVSQKYAAGFSALSRPAFVFSLGMVILGCHYRSKGLYFLNYLVSWKYLKPWSRLTYAAYLVHPMFMDNYYGSLETDVHYSTGVLMLLFFSFLTITYIISPLLVLFVEYPFRNLGDLLVKLPCKPKTIQRVSTI